MTRFSPKTILGIVLCLGLTGGCAGSPLGETLERSLEADPQLEESPAFGVDGSDAVPSTTVEAAPIADETTESIPAPTSTEALTASTAARAQTSVDPAALTDSVPRPGDPNFIGPLQPLQQVLARNTPQPELNLEGVPQELQDYVTDLAALEVLPLPEDEPAPQPDQPDTESANGSTAAFSQTISRREYARWLFIANNTFYQDVSSQRIRGGTTGDEPAFQDVPSTDPDFAAIQGLTEAGIIPSTLSGNSTAVNFRPDAPLTREALVLWKVPLDIHRALPQTTPEAVAERWGFQDVAQVEPLALRAVAADFELGDFSNIRRAFGYTILLQPNQAVTRAEAAAVLWRFGTQTEGLTAAELLQDVPSDS